MPNKAFEIGNEEREREREERERNDTERWTENRLILKRSHQYSEGVQTFTFLYSPDPMHFSQSLSLDFSILKCSGNPSVNKSTR